MEYSQFDVQDFLKDENFVGWATNPTQDQTFFWNAWISKNPNNVETLLKAKELVGSIKPKNTTSPSEDEFIEVLENILKKGTEKPSLFEIIKNSKLGILSKTFVKFSVAASLLIGFFVGLSILEHDRLFTNSDEATQISMVTRTTTSGQKITRHVLPDGSVISLNSTSSIRYPEKFDLEKREVFLEGEAFFDIKPDKKRPFLTHANGSVIKVLGTSFNINAFEADNKVEVAVKEGKVAVYPKEYDELAGDQEMLLLNPNEMATINTNSYEVLKSVVNIDNIICWKENLLLFQEDSFTKAIAKLERWYGVKFLVDAEVKPTGNWNGRFKNNSLEYVLNGMMFSSDLDFRLEGKKVYVTNKPMR